MTIARLHATLVAGCGFLLLMSPAPSSAQTIDTSGLELFWQTADRLASGDELSAADWDVLFEHPGYAVTEAAGQRRSVITHCVPPVFSPDGDPEAAVRRLPDGDGRVGLYERVCAHLQEVRLRRDALEGYFDTFDAGHLVREGRLRAARYLPEEGLEQIPPPNVYVILFEEQGFGRPDAIVVDGLTVMQRSDDRNAEFLGHEFHHAYRSAFRAPLPGGPGRPLLAALNRVVSEGVASMVDKAAQVRSGTIPPGFPPEFLKLVEDAPTRLARIDTALAHSEATANGFAAAARAVTEDSPWGGHLNGVYMAIAIEDGLGRTEVIASQRDPLSFLLAYQRAVDVLADGRFRFSEGSIDLVRRAMAPSPER